jgi:hypothetical protein
LGWKGIVAGGFLFVIYGHSQNDSTVLDVDLVGLVVKPPL